MGSRPGRQLREKRGEGEPEGACFYRLAPGSRRKISHLFSKAEGKVFLGAIGTGGS